MPSPRRPARAWSPGSSPIPRPGSRSSRPATTPTSSSRSSTAPSPSWPRPASAPSGSRSARCRAPSSCRSRRAGSRRAGYAAVICLGCVIQGETPHFTFVCAEAARGCTLVALETGVPVAFGVITAKTHEQAVARAGGAVGNKGNEAAAAALELSPACCAPSRRHERGARHAGRRHAGADRRCGRARAVPGGGRRRRAGDDPGVVDGARRSAPRDRRPAARHRPAVRRQPRAALRAGRAGGAVHRRAGAGGDVLVGRAGRRSCRQLHAAGCRVFVQVGDVEAGPRRGRCGRRRADRAGHRGGRSRLVVVAAARRWSRLCRRRPACR